MYDCVKTVHPSVKAQHMMLFVVVSARHASLSCQHDQEHCTFVGPECVLVVVMMLQVSELTRWRQETAIGYIAGTDGKLHLAPGPQEKHIFDEQSRVVVIAESELGSTWSTKAQEGEM